MAGEYGGDVSPDEAMTLLRQEKNAVLVDVRTGPEWSYVGVPDLSSLDKKPVFLEWQSYPAMTVNPDFVPDLLDQLDQRGTSKDTPILFLCRSGARSRSAAQAMTEAGYTRCLNIAGGFEGGPDPSRHRGQIEGWKAQSLPWIQP